MVTVRHRISPERSTFRVSASSSIHPIEAVATPRGWLDVAQGAEPLDPNGPIDGTIEVAVADLTSGNPLIDRETRRRIDAGRHPRITATLTGIASIDQGTAVVTGAITFLGETVDVEGELSVVASSPSEIVVEGEGSFDVRWWGLEPPRLFLLKVDPEVVIDIHLVLTPEPS